MNKLWTDDGWADYLYWQSQDKKTLKRINELIKDIESGTLALKYRKGFSRRIDETNRFVYAIDENGVLWILWIISCRGHY